jgi:hypothetical protein
MVLHMEYEKEIDLLCTCNKKNLMCEVVPSLFYFRLALLELFFWDDLFELMQWDHSYALNAKKLMDQRLFHMVQFNGCALQ